MRAPGVLILSMAAALAPVALAKEKPAAKPEPAYYASLAAQRARMRTGPGRNFPASWLYVRRNLPVRVIDSYGEWRKIEDPAGTQGWMLGTLVSKARTAIVVADAPVELRDRPAGATVLWRAAPGVVGKLSQCGSGWCRLDVNGQAGFVEVRGLWGVGGDETLP